MLKIFLFHAKYLSNLSKAPQILQKHLKFEFRALSYFYAKGTSLSAMSCTTSICTVSPVLNHQCWVTGGDWPRSREGKCGVAIKGSEVQCVGVLAEGRIKDIMGPGGQACQRGRGGVVVSNAAVRVLEGGVGVEFAGCRAGVSVGVGSLSGAARSRGGFPEGSTLWDFVRGAEWGPSGDRFKCRWEGSVCGPEVGGRGSLWDRALFLAYGRLLCKTCCGYSLSALRRSSLPTAQSLLSPPFPWPPSRTDNQA